MAKPNRRGSAFRKQHHCQICGRRFRSGEKAGQHGLRAHPPTK